MLRIEIVFTRISEPAYKFLCVCCRCRQDAHRPRHRLIAPRAPTRIRISSIAHWRNRWRLGSIGFWFWACREMKVCVSTSRLQFQYARREGVVTTKMDDAAGETAVPTGARRSRQGEEFWRAMVTVWTASRLGARSFCHANRSSGLPSLNRLSRNYTDVVRESAEPNASKPLSKAPRA